MNKIFDLSYLLRELRPIFRMQYLSADIFAGITVAFVAVPLSLAVAIASGMPPGVGLISAIVGSIIVALLGGTNLAITGPSPTLAILIASCVELYGINGLLVIGLVCGLLQLLSGIFGLGRYAKLVPLPVIAAFTAGIGFIIFVGQLPKALQLPAPDQNHVFAVILHIGIYITTMNPLSFALALLTLIILKTLPRFFPRLPTPLIAVAIPTAIVYFLHLTTIKLVGTIPHSLSLPHLPNISTINNWSELLVSAFEVFMLASLDTLLSSNAVDNMGIGNLHNSKQELLGQGIANICVALFGGLPVSGVIARSSINIAAGAKTRRSPIIHGLVILAIIYLCPILIENIPIAALAGILLGAALSLMNIRELLKFWNSDKSEVVIYLITFVTIIATDLINGVTTGIMVAFIMLAIRMLSVKHNATLWSNKYVLRITLSGNLTFIAFNKIEQIKEYIRQHIELKVVILEFTNLNGMDSSAAKYITNIINQLTCIHELTVILHNLNEQQINLIKLADPKEIKKDLFTHNESEIKRILDGLNIVIDDAGQNIKYGRNKFLNNIVLNKKLEDKINE
jgi:carbonic anhydrase